MIRNNFKFHISFYIYSAVTYSVQITFQQISLTFFLYNLYIEITISYHTYRCFGSIIPPS